MEILPTMNHRKQLLALTAALLGSLVLAAPATALKSQQAAFKVEVYAVQDSDWTLDSTEYDGCIGGDMRTYGSGRQSFSVTTRKPVKLTATYNNYGGYENTSFSVGKGTQSVPQSVPVNGAALREGTIDHQQLSGGESNCGGGGDGGGYVPPPPDCGARNFDAGVPLDYYFPSTYPGEITPLVPVLNLSGPFDDSDTGRVISNLWENCPGGALGDQLFLTPTGDLPLKKLFGKKEHFTVKAEDQFVNEGSSGGEFREVIQMSWRVEFKRLPAPT